MTDSLRSLATCVPVPTPIPGWICEHHAHHEDGSACNAVATHEQYPDTIVGPTIAFRYCCEHARCEACDGRGTQTKRVLFLRRHGVTRVGKCDTCKGSGYAH
jgi:hypothetical protein